MKRILAAVLAALLLLCGCGIQKIENDPNGTTNSGGDTPTAPTVSVDFAQSDAEMFTDRDSRDTYSENGSTVIELNGDSASCNSMGVSISGSTVTLGREGTYIFRGTLHDGMIIVDAGDNDKLQLVLDGASIASSTTAALCILNADKVFLTLAEGKENSLANGGSFAPDDVNGIDAALFSKQDLTINGSGSLTVSSPAGHGIACKDDLVFTGGNVTVNAASHGLDANDSVRIKAAKLTIDAGKDGIHAENIDDTSLGFVYISSGMLEIESEGDGISAGAYAQVVDGTVDILAGGGYENGSKQNSGNYGDFMGGGFKPGGMGGGRPRSASDIQTVAEEAGTSMKGVKAESGLLIGEGKINIDSADDAVHSNGSVAINGGNITIASGDDGIHAETSLIVTNGSIDISHSYEGFEALNIQIDGGEISLVATDDGFNAAGGVDSSGTGGRDEMFGGGMRPGGMGHGGMGGSSNGSIVINGGKLYVQASGDGMDANGYLEINGGYTVVCGPNRGDTATLDYDTGATINGGVFIGSGAAGMAQTFSANKQGVVAVSVGNGQTAGSTVTITDADGKEIVSHSPELDFSVFIYSAPEIVSGNMYHICVGSAEGDVKAD